MQGAVHSTSTSADGDPAELIVSVCGGAIDGGFVMCMPQFIVSLPSVMSTHTHTHRRPIDNQITRYADDIFQDRLIV